MAAMQGVKKRDEFSQDFCKFYVKRHWQIILFAILYITGLLTGIVFLFFASSSTFEYLCRMAEEYLFSRSQWERTEIFAASFLSVFWFLVLIFLLGCFPSGKWTCFPLIWFRGLGSGISIAAVCCRGGTEMISRIAVSLMPVALLQALTLLWACSAVWWYRNHPEERGSGYRMRFLFLTLLSAAAAALDAFLSSLPPVI